MPIPIDNLSTKKSLLDLSSFPKNSFNSVLYGFKLKMVLDDVLLVKYVDETDDGTLIKRRGLFVPVNIDSKAWRIGQVVLAGPNATLAKQGDYVIFPNNMGIPIANIEVEGQGTIDKGLFLNEQRIFGIADLNDSDESVASYNKNSAV